MRCSRAALGFLDWLCKSLMAFLTELLRALFAVSGTKGFRPKGVMQAGNVQFTV